jgi:hypothetical protein
VKGEAEAEVRARVVKRGDWTLVLGNGDRHAGDFITNFIWTPPKHSHNTSTL